MGILHSDSQSAIFLAKNLAFHSKSKHIQMRYNFICYLVEDKLVILEKIYGFKILANMLTADAHFGSPVAGRSPTIWARKS